MLGFRLPSIGLFGLGLLVLALLTPQQGYAQESKSQVCERALDAANDQYLEGAYGEAFRLVSACLNQDDIPQKQAVAAYRLVALIHLKQEALDGARSAIVNLLDVDSTYTADLITNPPAYVSLVSLVRQDLQREAKKEAAAADSKTPFFRRSSTWITMGSIVVGSGIATFFALDDGGGSTGGGEPPPSGPDLLPIPPGSP